MSRRLPRNLPSGRPSLGGPVTQRVGWAEESPLDQGGLRPHSGPSGSALGAENPPTCPELLRRLVRASPRGFKRRQPCLRLAQAAGLPRHLPCTAPPLPTGWAGPVRFQTRALERTEPWGRAEVRRSARARGVQGRGLRKEGSRGGPWPPAGLNQSSSARMVSCVGTQSANRKGSNAPFSHNSLRDPAPPRRLAQVSWRCLCPCGHCCPGPPCFPVPAQKWGKGPLSPGVLASSGEESPQPPPSLRTFGSPQGAWTWGIETEF